MRLGRPVSAPGGAVDGGVKQPSKYKYILAVIIVLVAAIAAFFYFQHRNNKPLVSDSPTSQDIKLLSDSKDAGDKRVVISSYLTEKNYNKAAELAQALAKSTGATEDYMTVVRICAGYDVSDKSHCLDSSLKTLESRLGMMSFTDAYNTGDMLDGANVNKDRAKFYQRAYDTYDPARAQYLMTKEQLKAKIDELNK